MLFCIPKICFESQQLFPIYQKQEQVQLFNMGDLSWVPSEQKNRRVKCRIRIEARISPVCGGATSWFAHLIVWSKNITEELQRNLNSFRYLIPKSPIIIKGYIAACSMLNFLIAIHIQEILSVCFLHFISFLS